MVSNLTKGRLWFSLWRYYRYKRTEEDNWDKADLALDLGLVWGMTYGYQAVGAAGATGAGMAFWIPQVVGAAFSGAVFGEEGLDDYLDFMEDVYMLDSESIGDKLSFTWDTLVLKKNRNGGGTSLSALFVAQTKKVKAKMDAAKPYGTDHYNAVMQERQNRAHVETLKNRYNNLTYAEQQQLRLRFRF